MQIKTFRANSIQEALQLVRDNLGPDACVHGTREVRGFIGRRLIEVEASSHSSEVNRLTGSRHFGNSTTTNPVKPNPSGAISQQDEPSIASQLLEAELLEAELQIDTANPQRQVQPASILSSSIAATNSEFNPRTPQLNAESFPLVDLPSLAAREVWNELLRNGVEAALAANLLSQAIQSCAPEFRNDAWLIRGQVNHLVAQRLRVADSKTADSTDQQRMIAMVGPTGVGKTTLLGKIAARAYRDSGLQIGIVTLDTWRDSAVEQLLEFAELVEAQLEVVGSIEQLAPALQRLREYDLVLIDTAGRSPNDSAQMQGLQELLQIAQPDETLLVLSGNASSAFAKNAIERFQGAGATHLCLSKLDEGGSLGQWLTALWSSSIPVMHITHGQDVEQDLITANVRHLASLFLGQASLSVVQ